MDKLNTKFFRMVESVIGMITDIKKEKNQLMVQNIFGIIQDKNFMKEDPMAQN